MEGEEIQLLDLTKKPKKDKKDKKEKEGSEKKPKKEKKDKKEEDKLEETQVLVETNPFEEGIKFEYSDLLDRITKIIVEKHPDLAGKETERISIKPPTIQLLPTKTAWDNFGECINTLGRDPEHLKKYIASELGTEAFLSAEDKIMMLKGRYKQP